MNQPSARAGRVKLQQLYLGLVCASVLWSSTASSSDLKIVLLDERDQETVARTLPIGEGFGELKWGISVEGAQKVHSDLREDDSSLYTKYYKGKDETWLVSDKRRLVIGEHLMDETRYTESRIIQ